MSSEPPGKLAQRVMKKRKPVEAAEPLVEESVESPKKEAAETGSRVNNLGKFAHPPKKK